MKNVNAVPVDVLELIPWYLTEKLSVYDRNHVDNTLKIYPELLNHLEFERRMLSLILDDKSILNKRIIASPENRLKWVFNKIDIQKTLSQSENEASNVTSMMHKLKDKRSAKVTKFDSTIHYSKVASVGILVLSLTTLSAFMISSNVEKSDFSLASAKVEQNQSNTASVNTVNTAILVGFGGTVDQLKNNPSLKGLNVSIQKAPDNDGIFKINFAKTMTTDAIQQIIHSLQAQEDTVWFAGEAY